jgi:hypothetical protein
MECMTCGRVAPADRETGYDADDQCAACAAAEAMDDPDWWAGQAEDEQFEAYREREVFGE